MLELVALGWSLAAVYILLGGATYAIAAAIGAVAASRRARHDWPRARARARWVRLYFSGCAPVKLKRPAGDYDQWGA